MTEPRDEELSRIYREARAPEPPPRLDEAILAASRRAAGSKPRAAGVELLRRSRAPVALAATILLTFTVTLMVLQDSRDPAGPSIAAKPPDTERRAEALNGPAKSEAAPSAPAGSTGNQRERDAEDPRSVGEGSDASRPGFFRARPSEPDQGVHDALAKKQNLSEPRLTERAPAALEAESSRPLGATQSTPVAPAPAASPRQETVPQRAGAARGTLADAQQRSPEKWIEDIRKLKLAGKIQEAERELAEFRKRHPGYKLPGDLH